MDSMNENAFPGDEKAAGGKAWEESDKYTTSTKSEQFSGALSFTQITATVPARLCKGFSLGRNGEIEKRSAGQLVEGYFKTVRVPTLAALVAHLDTLGPSEAVTWGTTPRYETGRIVTKGTLGDSPPPGTVARTREYFHFPRAPGVWMLDYDPAKGTVALGADVLFGILRDAAPILNGYPMAWRPSASSGIHLPGGEPSRGGQRIYVPVTDSAQIPDAGKALVTLLWAKGYGRYDVGKAGQLLERTTVDGSVWQPERLDFTGAPELSKGLVRTAPAAFIVGAGEYLDLNRVLALVDGDILLAAKTAKATARVRVEPQARQARDAWVETKAPMLAQRRAIPLDTARAVLHQACGKHTLYGDFELTTDAGEVVTVGTLLDDCAKWHSARFRDPLDPDYHGDTRIAWANLRSGGRPYVYSHAHGGCRYYLLRPTKRMAVSNGERTRILDQSLDVLREQVEVFDSANGMGLLRVTDDARVVAVGEDWLGAHLDRSVSYYVVKMRQEGVVEVSSCAPAWLPKRIRALAGSRNLPPLCAVASMPTLRPDGTILQKTGYDPVAKVLLVSHTESLPEIPTTPSVEETLAAVEVLWEPVRLFPFVDALSRSVTLAAMMTACLRALLPKAPGFGFDAPAAGTGKTLLAQVVGALMTGTKPDTTPPIGGTGAGADEEIRKRLFSHLREGSPVVLWDNLHAPLGAAALDAFLTGETYSDRILGVSEIGAALTNRSLFLVTGNNMRLLGDTCRRVLVARMDAKVETPFGRRFDFCPLQQTLAERGKLVQAALTITRGWITAGRPRQERGSTASYEDWDSLVRQPIAWLASMDPERWADTQGAMIQATENDPEANKLSALLNAWYALHKSKWVTVATMMEGKWGGVPDGTWEGMNQRVELEEALLEIAGDRSGQVNRRILGRWLETKVDRRCGGLRLERKHREGKTNAAAQWCVVAE